MMRVARAAAAHKTSLARYKAAVLFVPQPDCFLRGPPPTRGAELLNRYGLADLVRTLCGTFLVRTPFPGWIRTWLIFQTRDMGREGAFDSSGVVRLERILDWETCPRPMRRIVCALQGANFRHQLVANG